MRKHHKPIELKWPIYIVAVIMAFGSLYGFFAAYQLHVNQPYIEVGKNGCATRPAYEYFDRCDARSDSPACSYATQTNLSYWFSEFDTQCASMEDPRRFRFPVSDGPEIEVAEAG